MTAKNITNLQQAAELAHNIAKELKQGSVIALEGDLGAGKTFIAKHLISTILQKDTAVHSPTFQLLQIYKAPSYDIYHYDLYRLKNKNEIFELAIEDALNGQNICIIEWPEIVFDLLPQETIVVNINFSDDNSRIIEVSKKHG